MSSSSEFLTFFDHGPFGVPNFFVDPTSLWLKSNFFFKSILYSNTQNYLIIKKEKKILRFDFVCIYSTTHDRTMLISEV